MNPHKFVALLLAPMFLLLAVTASAVAADAVGTLPPAHQVVQKATSDVLARIVKERPKFEKDPKYLNTIIEENLVPYVDFNRIAKRVMAKYYQQASADQRTRFQDAFKTSLIKAYGSALANYNDQKFEVVKPGKTADNDPGRATVDMDITMKDGSVYRVQYAMYLNDQGAWKLENLVLEGINLGLTYRNNFAEMYQQYGGDIDKVIANWSSRVEADQKKKADGKKAG